MKNAILIYGSYGYTGSLIVAELSAHNIPVVLCGRNANELKKQHDATGFPYRVVKLEDRKTLIATLADIAVVMHCAGPFIFTSKQMIEACLETNTHYTDITGEFKVFDLLETYDTKAKEKNITVMPGTGFDVVPSDCLAAHLKTRLPDATHLQLAFTSLKGSFSRGTARTGIENLGEGSYIRVDGKLKNINAGSRTKTIDFGSLQRTATAIPWGDISTAYRSTGIPNIEVYMGVPEKTLRMIRLANHFSWLLKQRWAKYWLRKLMDRKPAGPSEGTRRQSKSLFWGEVTNAKGDIRTSLLETYDGYTLTAKTSTSIVLKILQGNFKAGYQTPSTAYGKDLILEFDHTRRTDL